MQLGQFTLTGEIARSAHAVVYSARLGEREVALKVLGALDDGARRRFLEEVERLALLDRHPGVVHVLAAGAHQGLPWIATERADGPSLQERLEREGPLPSREVVRLGLGLARALAHLHDGDVPHRHLEPANVLLGAGSRSMLVDLGSGSAVGGPGYWSPEQALGRAAVGVASDLYRLGATLFAAVTGRPPVLDDERGAPPRPSALVRDVDPGLEAVLLRCLERDPAWRYPTADDVAAALEDCRARPQRRSRRGTVAGALGLSVVAGLNVVGLTVLASRASPSATPTPTTPSPAPPEAPWPEPLVEPPPPEPPPPPPPPPLFLHHPGTLGRPVPSAKRSPIGDRDPWVMELERKLGVAPGSIDVDGSTADLSAAEYAALPENPRAAASSEVDGLVERSRARERAGDLRGAEADLEAAVALRRDAVLLERLGELRLQLEDRAGALQAFDAAVEVAPGRLTARYSRGLTRLMLGDATGARADLDVVLAKSPDDAQALFLRAHAFDALGDRAALIADLRAVVALAPPGSELAVAAEAALTALGVAPRDSPGVPR